MSRLYCQHLVPMDGIETCVECDWAIRQHWMGGELDVFAAARAWQALRDWCNGTPEQWRTRERQSYAKGYDDGYEDHRANTRDH